MHFEKYSPKLVGWERYVQWLTSGFFCLFAIMLLNPGVSIGGDDSWYIVAANDFLRGNGFPQWHGAFYPIFLSGFVALFDIKILLFKILSIALSLGGIIIFYKTIRKVVPIYLAVIVLLVYAFNFRLIYYASTTYSEPMFLLIQALVFYTFFQLVDKINQGVTLKESWKYYLFLGGMIFLLGITRNIGLGALVAVVLYLLIDRKFIQSLWVVLSFIVFYVPYNLYKKLFWSVDEAGFENQLRNIAYKNFYQHDKGTEDLMGFVVRFWENCNQYLSNFLMRYYGLHSYESAETNVLVTILILLIFIGSSYWIFTKNRKLFFVVLYLVILVGGTFVTQQVHWNQERLILIYLPLITVCVGFALVQLFSLKSTRHFQLVITIFFAFVLLTNFKQIIKNFDSDRLLQTIHGDKYQGYTNDWLSYLSLCEWVGDNISEDQVVLCRKPNMAEVYSGRKFKGVHRVPSKNPHEVKKYLDEKEADYIIMASLRLNPKVKTGSTIRTIPNVIKLLLSEYPASIKLIRQHGKSEPAVLLRYEPAAKLDNMENIRDGLKLYPDNVAGNFYCALNLHNQNKTKQAEAFLLKAKKYNPDNPEIILLSGHLNYRLQNYEKAVVDFTRVVKAQPENGKAWFNLAMTYHQLKLTENMIEAATQARKLGFENIPEFLFKA